MRPIIFAPYSPSGSMQYHVPFSDNHCNCAFTPPVKWTPAASLCSLDARVEGSGPE